MHWFIIALIFFIPGLVLVYAATNEAFRVRTFHMHLDFYGRYWPSMISWLKLLLGGILLMVLGLGAVAYAFERGYMDFYFGTRGGAQIIEGEN